MAEGAPAPREFTRSPALHTMRSRSRSSVRILLVEDDPRMRTLVRRGLSEHGHVVDVADSGPSALEAATVTRADAVVSLTPTEFNLLECLMRNVGRVVTRQMLIERLWGSEQDVESNTLDAFVKSLRQKLDAGDRPRLIHTVRGVGYSLRE